MHKVVIFVPQPVAVFELGCALEIFALERPEIEGGWYHTVLAAENRGMVSGTLGLPLLIDNDLSALRAADTIVVPCWNVEGEPSRELVAAFWAAAKRNVRILSICSGAFLLAHCGLLDGRRATTHWKYAERFRQRFPQIELLPDVLYVDEGSIVTSAGSAAGLDMMLHIVRKDFGSRICNTVARRLVLPPHREGGQAQFVERPVAEIADSRLARVIEWMRVNAKSEIRIEDLANEAAMSPRTFFRRFREATGLPPNDWLIRERVSIAKELLETARLPIEHVATEAGFGSVETLRHHFRRHLRTSPVEYRKTYSEAKREAEQPRSASR